VTTYTVDVSHHDWDRAKGEIDWVAAARSGIAAACVRASYGDPEGFSPPSRHAAEMIGGARAAGLITGAYHNLVRGDDASILRQVDRLRAAMDAHGAVWAMLDVERYEELVANGLWPRFADVRAFTTRWHAVDDRPLLVYLPRWNWLDHLGSPGLSELGCPLVASDYGDNSPGAPAELYAARDGDDGRGWAGYGGVTPALWQFGSRARVPGLAAPTDINAYRGSPARLRALLTGDDGMDLDDIVWTAAPGNAGKVPAGSRTVKDILTALDSRTGLLTNAGYIDSRTDAILDAVRQVLAEVSDDPSVPVTVGEADADLIAKKVAGELARRLVG
jgi:hypothetical protein